MKKRKHKHIWTAWYFDAEKAKFFKICVQCTKKVWKNV